jgi:hypothetical protein
MLSGEYSIAELSFVAHESPEGGARIVCGAVEVVTELSLDHCEYSAHYD